MKRCDWCFENAAIVFTPTVALCRSCRAELERQEAADNAVSNGPTCATCGAVLNRSQVCPDCCVRDVTEAHREMARVS